MNMTSARNSIPRPRLENTTATVRNPEVTVELEPSGVSGGGRKVRKSNYLFCSTTGVLVWYYSNLTKIGPLPVMNEVVANGALSQKYTHRFMPQYMQLCYPLTTDQCTHYATLATSYQLAQFVFEDRFCSSKNSGIGGGGRA